MGRPSTRGDITEAEMTALIKVGGLYEGRDGSWRHVVWVKAVQGEYQVRWRLFREAEGKTHTKLASSCSLPSFARWAIKVVG